MLRTIAVFGYFNVLVFGYFQKDYFIKYERVTDMYWNRDRLQEFNFSHSFFNRTTKVFGWTMTLIKPLSTHLKFKVQTYKFLSNEYRYFPVFYEENPCLAMAADVFGNSVTHFDTNVKACPLAKVITIRIPKDDEIFSLQGFYYARNITFDQSRLPPYAPRGRFMFDLLLLENNVAVIKSKIHVNVVPTNPLEIVPS